AGGPGRAVAGAHLPRRRHQRQRVGAGGDRLDQRRHPLAGAAQRVGEIVGVRRQQPRALGAGGAEKPRVELDQAELAPPGEQPLVAGGVVGGAARAHFLRSFCSRSACILALSRASSSSPPAAAGSAPAASSRASNASDSSSPSSAVSTSAAIASSSIFASARSILSQTSL